MSKKSEQKKIQLEKKRMQEKRNRTLGIAAAVIAVLAFVVLIFAGQKKAEPEETIATSASGTSGQESEAAESEVQTEKDAQSVPAGAGRHARIEIQDYGTITIALDEETAPISTQNFIRLAESGFYDGLTFHRIMEDFMMQGGDPNGNGTGGAEQMIEGEFAANGHDNPLSHTRGAVSMARSNDYNSASSQFFIVHQDSTFLDGQYAVFGYVTEGIEVVDAVCEAAQPVDGNGTILAEEQPVITSIEIFEP